eukprot:m.1185402 g.1185402  ORF g.1185402 m.1185402 type:complete len:195 (+) comp24544_c1_seq40:312-896(+)
MEIINANSALLSNFEVLSLVQETAKNLKGSGDDASGGGGIENLNTITYELDSYLSRMPSSVQSKEIVIDFLEKIRKYNFTKPEKLQLLNFRPKSEVVFLRLVDGGEERYSSETIDEVLHLIADILPEVPEEAEELEEGEDAVGEEPVERNAPQADSAAYVDDGTYYDDHNEHEGQDDLVNEHDAVDSDPGGDDD